MSEASPNVAHQDNLATQDSANLTPAIEPFANTHRPQTRGVR
jgi:hypothetical protein